MKTDNLFITRIPTSFCGIVKASSVKFIEFNVLGSAKDLTLKIFKKIWKLKIEFSKIQFILIKYKYIINVLLLCPSSPGSALGRSTPTTRRKVMGGSPDTWQRATVIKLGWLSKGFSRRMAIYACEAR